MHRDNDRYKMFSRRSALIGGLSTAMMATLVGRMYFLQVVEAKKYRTLAEDNRINMRLLPPPRGIIMDRFAVPLAINQQTYRLVLVSEQAGDIAKTLDAVARLIVLSDADRQQVLRETARKRPFVPVTVRDNLNWAEVARIEVNAADLPGITIDVGQSRYYPDGINVAHVLGYVAAVAESELTGDPLLELPGFRIGKTGIEKVYDMSLRGTGGTSRIEVNAVGRVIREVNRQEGQPGQQIRLTLDSRLQRFTNQRLKNESGAAVVLNCHTGDLLALASMPSFDPNAFNHGISQEEWRLLLHNPLQPLNNKAIAGQYAPGSTFKMVVLLAGLEKGVINADNSVFCRGFLELGDSTFHCWKEHGHGSVNAEQALAQSCDVYFYELARRVGIESIAITAKRLGLGAPSGINLPGEATGLIPTPHWKSKTLKRPWLGGETLLAGIGQGYVLATPLQLATMAARLVNGGKAVVPRVTLAIDDTPPLEQAANPEFSDLGFSPAHLKLIREGMLEVVNGPKGTARRSAFADPTLLLGGKTGTSQVRRITKEEREKGLIRNEDLPWGRRDHALFVGFAPGNAPRYVTAVVIEHGGSGSRAAAPVASDILYEALRLSATVPEDNTTTQPAKQRLADAALPLATTRPRVEP